MKLAKSLEGTYREHQCSYQRIGLLHGVANGWDGMSGISFIAELEFFVFAVELSLKEDRREEWKKALQLAITRAFPEGHSHRSSFSGNPLPDDRGIGKCLIRILDVLAQDEIYRHGFIGFSEAPYDRQTTAFLKLCAESFFDLREDRPYYPLPIEWWNAAIASGNMHLVKIWAQKSGREHAVASRLLKEKIQSIAKELDIRTFTGLMSPILPTAYRQWAHTLIGLLAEKGDLDGTLTPLILE